MDDLYTGSWLPGKHGSAVLLLVALVASVVVKRRYLSSISDIPGPVLASFSVWWQIYHIWKGHTEVEVVRLHRQYGESISSS